MEIESSKINFNPNTQFKHEQNIEIFYASIEDAANDDMNT